MGRLRRRRLLNPIELGERARTDRAPRPGSRHIVEVEDLLLAAWVAGLDYLARRTMGRPESLLDDITGPTHWLALLLISVWLFLIVTRGPDEDDADRALMRRVLMVGPAFPVLSIYSLIGRGVHSWMKGPQPLSADGYPPWPGPAVSRLWRRTAALPLMIMGDAVFQGSVSNTPIGPRFEMTFEHAYFLVAAGAIYVFTVAGPRIVAGATLSPLVWIARFGLFLAAVWYGMGR
jgi:hypothetical protein